MKVKQNIGILNAFIRITIGLAVLSWTTARMAKKPRRGSYKIIALLGGMKVAEGILRYCPLTALYEKGKDMENGEGKAENHYSRGSAKEEHNSQSNWS
ncbi:YgaP family membrane protein [Bacillus sp. T33-2]|uniref:YgaP family membrane protein n=1 Tax=Bacillus sp. T33-2 TaxID=2054168 RepID=UPI000C765ED2|nr:DUF2892 domain-containing protein [Bacillus sp. T33-2]PLR99207.1 DUF2892 domain-containing protein [Bacillus sp. T33-2]